MSRNPFANYDAWLEKPYQNALANDESEECPCCGAEVEVVEDGRVIRCKKCDWSTFTHLEQDWDPEYEQDYDPEDDSYEDFYFEKGDY